MLRQPKYQSILVFALCLSGVVLELFFDLDWLRWHIMVVDSSSADYRIEQVSQTFTTSSDLTSDIFPYDTVHVFSSKGQCVELNEVRWKVSANDRLKEKWIIELCRACSLLSLVLLILAFINLLWRWWEIAVFVFLGIYSWILFTFLFGSHMSIEPDISKYDFYCAETVTIKAEFVSVNPPFVLIILMELIAIVLLIRSLFVFARQRIR